MKLTAVDLIMGFFIGVSGLAACMAIAQEARAKGITTELEKC